MIKIEVGKNYALRNGLVATVKRLSSNVHYPYSGTAVHQETGRTMTELNWKEDGEYSRYGTHPLDVVSEILDKNDLK